FANAGTDFAPIIEAYGRRSALGLAAPRPITVPHEVTAVAMAHGHAMVSGRPQAVMVHVTVGTANALGGLMNAARSNTPIFFTAGRTPISESGSLASRDRPIHWAQESFDQGAIVREFVKWDYELRTPAQLETVVDRALVLARTEPAGPVYLTLPREVLGERLETFEYADPPRVNPTAPTVASPEAVAEAARWLAEARNPVIVSKAGGRDPGAVPALAALAEAGGIPVFSDLSQTYLNFPHDHPLHAGFAPGAALDEADVVLVVESEAPWFPRLAGPRPEARVIQLGVDPIFSRYPVRGFAGDLALGGTPRLTLGALADAVRGLADPAAVRERTARWTAHHRTQREAWARAGQAAAVSRPIEMTWVSRCIGAHLDDRTIVVNEYDLDMTQVNLTRPGSYFASSPAGGLGWALGAALGAKVADPDRTVIACVGDGSYIFGAPTAAHFVSRAYGIPVLVVIFNNRAWNAVKRAVHSFAPDGWAARGDTMALSDLDPAPDYELVCQASGGHAERVEEPEALPEALARALRVVREEKRQALLNVICRKP
ncbi:MAG TPA: thiamine pyrophosphate-requiring protein, partial [Candidatus Binatia bacterium]|nr:thiamine pyrophosphate-requiring protein [Candidatus Binatia bacterium]